MSHYFHTPTGEEHRRFVRMRFWETDWQFATADGVFSADGLDLGTSVLLRESTPPAGAARLLDLGCGYGVIGLAVAAAVPDAVVTGVDVNERAVLLANDNAAALGLSSRYHAAVPSQVPGDATFDEIWSNPPIRIGKEALHELLRTWLGRLVSGGRAVLVVGKNLGADSLQRWLDGQGYPTVRLASAKGFRVLESRRP